jgi:hypothetical protein
MYSVRIQMKFLASGKLGVKECNLMLHCKCGLFYSAVSSSGYTASNYRPINEQWIGKDTKGSGRALIQVIIHAYA